VLYISSREIESKKFGSESVKSGYESKKSGSGSEKSGSESKKSGYDFSQIAFVVLSQSHPRHAAIGAETKKNLVKMKILF
jgi:hypothetical protein